MASRVVNYHIGRLKDKNPEVRLKSIEELRLIGDIAALDPLKEVFETDEDPAVRKAAQEAGRQIFVAHNKKKKSP